MRIRSRLAILGAKLARAAIRTLKLGNGSTFPGVVARRIDPDILSVMSVMVHEKIIAVTGTNGKTTTNSILRNVLEAEGKSVVSNKMGANLLDGIVSAFVLTADWRGRLDTDYACIEVDELSTVEVFPVLKPDCVLLTNIFRDQLDRTGEVDAICQKIRQAVLSVPAAKLAVCCDDICSHMLISGCEDRVVTFGIDEKLADDLPVGTREIIFCPVCGNRLEYDFFQYGQLGRYHCMYCGLERPRPDVAVTEVTFQGGVYSYTLEGKRIKSRAHAPYSVYNALSAYGALKAADAPLEKFGEVMERYDYGNSRECVFNINKTKVQLHLAKNPVGLQQKLFLIRKDPGQKDVVIQINDTKLDGEDVSWLWDVDYRYLAEAETTSVTVAGMRRADVELCLKYDGISCRSTEDVWETVEALALEESKNVYIITNYSGLYEAGRMLEKLQSAWKEGGCL